MWHYESPIGTIYIKRVGTGYGIIFEDGNFCCGGYTSPDAAAGDVYAKATGYDGWDLSDVPFEDIPTDLAEWE